MERLSSFERIVGNISEAEKDQILRDKGERFDDQAFESLRGKEREKTPEELRIINLANDATNEVRRKYGLENFDIPPENIHIIAEEAWPQDRGTALYNSMLQGIAAREQLAKMAFMKKIFHEMLHFKSYNALQMTTADEPEINEYRVGLTVHTRAGKTMYFANLNEAVTEEMTKKSGAKIFGDPLFAEEVRQTKDVISRYPRAVTGTGEVLFDNDTFYAEVESKKSWREAVGRLFGAQEKPKKITTESFTYSRERRILNKLIDKIFERNHEDFQDREEIFEIFAKGMMTGNILHLGKLIERTFDNGTLRRIGELDQDMGAQEEFVDSL